MSDLLPALPEAFTGLHGALHQARSFALADMPSNAPTILSVGPNGLWYFDWFAETYGDVPRHIGVEAYTDRPPVLPPNVEWIEADVAGPEGVRTLSSGGVDLVFSGQNIEHLWPDQIEAFLIESNRVLRDGGWLILDSPNREITAAYQWSMSEHTVELTPAEARSLLTLAGFEVETMKGLWLCRHHGELLPLDPDGSERMIERVLERMMLASQRPADSFIWWAEARKVAEPDRRALSSAIRAIFAANWVERVSRIGAVDGVPVRLADGRPGVRMEKGQWGCSMMGPSMALRPGAYTLDMEVAWSDCEDLDEIVAQMDVLADDQILDQVDLYARTVDGQGVLTCSVVLDQLRFAVHARLFSTGRARVDAPPSLTISPDPYGLSADH